MASIGSISGGGSVSSIYGNKNIISGLASGMDTESMIENAVSGYKLKLSMLQQQRTVVEWQQTAYRSIIDKMINFNRKYLSFSSGNNLMSGSFFDSAVKVNSLGPNADKITASGKSSSNVVVNSVTQLASNTKYSINAGNMAPSNVASGSFDVNGKTSLGTLNGYMTIGYGGSSINIRFDEGDVFKSADEMAAAINKKLEETTISFNGGGQDKASERVQAVVKDVNGKKEIQFTTVKDGDTNTVWIDAASDELKADLQISPNSEKRDVKGFTFKDGGFVEEKSIVELFNDKGFSMTVDGEFKTVKGPAPKKPGETWTADEYMKELQKNIDEAFGPGKLKVSNASTEAGKIQLSVEGGNSHTKFSVSSNVGGLAAKDIGMSGSLTSYVNTSRKLGDLITNGSWDSWRIEAKGTVKEEANGTGKDEDGNLVKKDDTTGKWYRVDKDGNELYDFTVNGKSVGTFTKDSSLKDVMNAINSSENSDVKVAYSEFTGKFTFEAKQGGAAGKIELGGGLASAMFGSTDKAQGTLTQGQNAKVSISVNGEPAEEMEFTNNNIEIDGLNITLKGTFEESSGAVSFSTTTDSDKIVKVVKEMIDDYNAMAKEIKDAYSTLPMQDSKGKNYMPLTDEQRSKMSESEIKNYEEKAKTGILFADRELSSLYTGLRDALGALGVTGNDASNLGITTSFEGGHTIIALDESKFRTALEQDPEKVKDIFTRSKANGASSDGLMQGLKIQMDKYAKDTGAMKGILIQKAGSTAVPTSIFQNEMQKKMGEFDKQILSWQDKLSDKIDYYNRKFTALEMMVAEMNNQSSLLMGMGGGF